MIPPKNTCFRLLFTPAVTNFAVRRLELMENRKAFVFAIPYKTRLDMIQVFLRVYNGYLESIGRRPVSDRTINLLSFYICYGYSDDTRARYMACYGQKESYVAVLNNELKRYGFLVDKRQNYRSRGLSRDMASVRNYFVLDGDGDDMRVMGLVFKRQRNNVSEEDTHGRGEEDIV